jgi:hypothetical protein
LPSLTLRLGTYDAVIPGTYLNANPAGGTCKWSTVSLSNDRLADLFD